jgi:tetratricopeptide (TPR) repeat protein
LVRGVCDPGTLASIKGGRMNRTMAAIITAMFLTGAFVWAQERFDMKVRNDFFAGIAGNREAFERAMTTIEQTLKANPKHAEAKVWHGAGVFYRATEAFQKGDSQTGVKLWQDGLNEMEAAVKLDANNVSVIIPRGASLIASSRFAPPEFAKPILETAVSDYEKVLKIQEPEFEKLSQHSRGELLTGLADGWSRLGNNEKARRYFERISAELKGSVYEQKAKAWLDNRPEVKSPTFFNCSGCHVN